MMMFSLNHILGVQMGLFHGRNQLCDLETFTFKYAPNDEGSIKLEKVKLDRIS